MIYRLSDFRFPDQPERLYPQTAQRPWVLEIGFGDGRFWPHYAQTFDQAPNYLGVELSGVSLLKAGRRLRAAGLENAILTKLNAEVLLREIIPAGSLSHIIVNFPDPWPKADHLEHRLLRVPFFQLAASRLQPDGSILLTTDHAEYFEFACQQATQSGVMSLSFPPAPAAALETKYAQKWRDLGLEVNHVRFTPTRATTADYSGFLPYSEELATMPHAILTLPPTFDPQHFEKFTLQHPKGLWTAVLLDLYSSVRRSGWVVLAHVVEAELTQEVLIGVTVREDGSTLVRLNKFGGPVVTPGVKGAVQAVTEWLRASGATVTHLGY